MSKYLIVNADDFNLTEGVTRGILDGHRRGIITSTTVMVNLPGLAVSRDLARQTPGLGLGLHVNLTLGAPVLAAVRCRRWWMRAGASFGTGSGWAKSVSPQRSETRLPRRSRGSKRLLGVAPRTSTPIITCIGSLASWRRFSKSPPTWAFRCGPSRPRWPFRSGGAACQPWIGWSGTSDRTRIGRRSAGNVYHDGGGRRHGIDVPPGVRRRGAFGQHVPRTARGGVARAVRSAGEGRLDGGRRPTHQL